MWMYLASLATVWNRFNDFSGSCEAENADERASYVDKYTSRRGIGVLVLAQLLKNSFRWSSHVRAEMPTVVGAIHG